ncbi:bifunctional diguanylate cyclase/phosphodiesterase [Spartinivicinus poritis]|uniref:EAL domain-containing protein n=1 Tax=Spartinivicinus poritis TaxID=2994640 RepID=A0ABT5UHB5_9GAMM|nr:EAL domain-containing protein [Spartinivicinus sp. A2-2]MDE1464892.1 EAL domain-containing protein [Spartinivicinus sp. A2-2]
MMFTSARLLSLRLLIPLFVMVLFGILITGILLWNAREALDQKEEEVLGQVKREITLLQQKMSEAFVDGDWREAEEFLVYFGIYPEFNSLALVTPSKEILYATRFAWKDQLVVSVLPNFDISQFAMVQLQYKPVYVKNDKKRLLQGYVPVELGLRDHELRSNHLAVLYVEYDLNQLHQEVWYNFWTHAVVLLLAGLLTALALLWGLSYWVIHPIKVLVEAAKRVGKGNYDVHVQLNESREFNKLGRTLNLLAHEVRRNMTELAERKIRFDDFLQSGLIGMAIIKPNMHWQEFNNRLCEILHYQPEQMMEQDWFELTHPDDRETERQLLRKVLAGEWESYTLDKRMCCSDDEVVYVSVNTKCVRALSGKPDYFVVFAQDITERKNSEIALMEEQALFNTILDNIVDGIAVCNREGILTLFNKSLQNNYGLLFKRLPPEKWLEHYPVYQADGKTPMELSQLPLFRALHGEQVNDLEMVFSGDNQQPIVVLASSNPLINAAGKKLGAVASYHNITQRVHAESEMRLAAIAFETHEAIMITDHQHKILRVNNAFTEITGYDSEEVIGCSPNILSSGQHDDQFFQAINKALAEQGYWEGEIWNRRKNREIYPQWETITAVKNKYDQITHYVSTFEDLTERLKSEAEIQRLAFFDSLTGLPNRRYLDEQLQSECLKSLSTRLVGALLIVDLDHFKTINDSRGHQIGDELLKQVAERLTLVMEEDHTLARQGGDEFVILLEGFSTDSDYAVQQVTELAIGLLEQLHNPFIIEGENFHITGSIGIATYPFTADNPIDLMKRADAALHRAKEAGRNTIQFFSDDMQQEADKRLQLHNELRQAVETEQLILYFQPQVSVNEGHVVGAEVLVRWLHPERGIVSPVDFIPYAEETGLIYPLGMWVIRQMCQLVHFWQAESTGCSVEHFSVNISPYQFYHPDFISEVINILELTQVPGHCLMFEITEGLVLDNLQDTVQKMEKLRELGIRFSIDDFGTGYSSLSYLRKLPLDELKVDKSFIDQVLHDSSNQVIVETIISMARHLQLKIVAEGVETSGQLDFLREHQCDLYQGYYFSPPLPYAEFRQRCAKEIKPIEQE